MTAEVAVDLRATEIPALGDRRLSTGDTRSSFHNIALAIEPTPA
jgi:hypothetical protein